MNIEKLKFGDKIKIVENGKDMNSLVQLKILVSNSFIIGKVLTVREIKKTPNGVYYVIPRECRICIYDEMIDFSSFNVINRNETIQKIANDIMIGDKLFFKNGKMS